MVDMKHEAGVVGELLQLDFHSRTRAPFEPPHSAVIGSSGAIGWRASHPSSQQRITLTANSAVSLVIPTLSDFGVGGQVVNAVGHSLAKLLVDEVVHVGAMRMALGTVVGSPLLVKLPTSSFFFVSTEITGCPAACAATTWVLMCSNWAFGRGALGLQLYG